MRKPIVPAALAALCAAVAPPVLAQPAAAEPGGSFVGELLAILVPLGLVIVVLLVVLRLLRRRYGLTGGDAPLSVLQILPLGPRERLVLLRSRSGRVFTVGVGLHAVTYITDLTADDLKPLPPGTAEDSESIHTSVAG